MTIHTLSYVIVNEETFIEKNVGNKPKTLPN